MKPIQFKLSFVSLIVFTLSLTSPAFAQSCEDVCAAANEGGTVESTGTDGSTITCCCLSPDNAAPYTSQPAEQCTEQ